MDSMVDDRNMTALVILFGIVLVGVLAVLLGADSRPVDRGYPRRNWF